METPRRSSAGTDHVDERKVPATISVGPAVALELGPSLSPSKNRGSAVLSVEEITLPLDANGKSPWNLVDQSNAVETFSRPMPKVELLVDNDSGERKRSALATKQKSTPKRRKRGRRKMYFEVERIVSKKTFATQSEPNDSEVVHPDDDDDDDDDDDYDGDTGDGDETSEYDGAEEGTQQSGSMHEVQLQPDLEHDVHDITVPHKWTVSLMPLALALDQAMSLNGAILAQLEIEPATLWPTAGCGCLVHFDMSGQGPTNTEPDPRFWKSSSIRKQILKDLDLNEAVSGFLAQPVDSIQDIALSIKAIDELRGDKHGDWWPKNLYGIMEDWFFWQREEGLVPLRDLTKLRRILLPVTLVVTCNDRQTLVALMKLDWSLADMIVEGDNVEHRTALLMSLLRSLQAMKQVNYASVAPMDDLLHYNEVQDLIVSTCRRTGGTVSLDGTQIDLEYLSVLDNALPVACHETTRRSYSVGRALEIGEIQDERNKMLEKYHAHLVTDVRKINGAPKMSTITLEKDRMTETNFLKLASFMHRVNGTIPRQWDPLESRPRFSRAQLTDTDLTQLRNVFFEANGSLKLDCIRDASMTLRNQYISFCNDSGAGTNDKRWQIPIRDHKLRKVASRLAVENVLIRAGMIDPQNESIKELSILIGGTEDQALHHDLPRDWITWRKSPRNRSETVGWEANRFGYNASMCSEHAPSAMILPMKGSVLLGVQKDQVVRTETTREGGGQIYCRIQGGDPGEDFEIVRESKYMVVLKLDQGCVFTGDFPHAGVFNLNPSQIHLKQTLDQFFAKIDDISSPTLNSPSFPNDTKQPDYAACTKAVLQLCSKTAGLDGMSRLYISTESKEIPLNVPENVVGYAKCYSNSP